MGQPENGANGGMGITVVMANVSVAKRRMKHVRLTIDDSVVDIPVSESVYAYWDEQFCRKGPSDKQRRQYTTIKNLMRYAYQKGRHDERQGI